MSFSFFGGRDWKFRLAMSNTSTLRQFEENLQRGYPAFLNVEFGNRHQLQANGFVLEIQSMVPNVNGGLHLDSLLLLNVKPVEPT